MNIKLNMADDRAVWIEQICDQIKAGIASGEIPPGSLIPSMRMLAKELGIGIENTQRAYMRLKREGVLVRYDAKGAIVAGEAPAAEAPAEEVTETPAE